MEVIIFFPWIAKCEQDHKHNFDNCYRWLFRCTLLNYIETINMKIKLIYLFILSNILFSQYEYSKEDMNSTSTSFGEMVWQPTYVNYITLHYFTTQGWAGWTNIFGQLSDFQDELHAEGYEKVVIIGVGQSAQSNFNSNFCANSDLPFISDQSPNLPIYNQFNGGHRDLGCNGCRWYHRTI